MRKDSPFNFEYSYLSLPETFYSLVKPHAFPAPKMVLFNEKLSKSLELKAPNEENIIETLLKEDKISTSFAQAYAGHQFGTFTKLGDGRAIVIGEQLTEGGGRFDVQLKGSGRTPYSRGGDGKATIKAMLREYLISEVMFRLNIPTSRSLAVIQTGEPVFRNEINQGAALVRIMKSHIRVGTFEYAAHICSQEDLQALCDYTIKRLYPEIKKDENSALSLLYKVMENQIDLVVNWMRIGFIHGVMNTDNTSISGETFDYGPCAFMNRYHPDTVYSSIDQNGRYSFSNQAKIIKWNIARFAEALLGIIDNHPEKSLALAQKAIDDFDALWLKSYYSTMLKKIGLSQIQVSHTELFDELLDLMENLQLDYTNTFKDLSLFLKGEDHSLVVELNPWLEKWKNTLDQNLGTNDALQLMSYSNPIYIPRNHLVENAIEKGANGEMEEFQKLVAILSNPYQFQDDAELFSKPSPTEFDRSYQTFCGT